MSLRCILGLHRPSPLSIRRNEAGLRSLCENCGLPLQKTEGAKWVEARPLAAPAVRESRT
ncbi:hypothetical protein [Allosphingosinicella deserti]|uniref:hypothetical protein n=1 Tax=Allosphingosinicella deserti TaxID=2116704 RepID=UPI000D0BBCBE|nr:hypothetical protein [Sphingomonas deserti]